MGARETYAASVKTANDSKLSTAAAAVTTHQVTIDAANSVVGYNHQTGNNVTLRAAVAAANKAKLDAIAAAETAKQAAIEKARDTLRDSGDKAPS